MSIIRMCLCMLTYMQELGYCRYVARALINLGFFILRHSVINPCFTCAINFVYKLCTMLQTDRGNHNYWYRFVITLKCWNRMDHVYNQNSQLPEMDVRTFRENYMPHACIYRVTMQLVYRALCLAHYLHTSV